MSCYDMIMSRRKEIKEILERGGCLEPKLFGSVARKEDTEKSDIDILYTPAVGANYYDICGAELELTELLGKEVELVNNRTLKDLFRPHVERDLVPL